MTTSSTVYHLLIGVVYSKDHSAYAKDVSILKSNRSPLSEIHVDAIILQIIESTIKMLVSKMIRRHEE